MLLAFSGGPTKWMIVKGFLTYTGVVGATHRIPDPGWSRRLRAEGARNKGRNVQRLREHWRG